MRDIERGASAVEYGLMLAAIAGAVVLALYLLGPVIAELFSDTCTSFDAAAATSAACP